MNTAPMIFLCGAVAVGASAVTTMALLPTTPMSGNEPAAEPGELALLRERIKQLDADLGALRASNSSAELPLAARGDRINSDEIDRAVRRYMEGLGQGGMALASQAVDEGVEASKALSAEDFLAQLETEGLDENQRNALWKQLRDAGQLDKVVALLEARAEANPNDPDAQVEVAQAYIQKIFEAGEGPEAGLWAGKADSSFDRALEIEPRHWDARFNKAISLSFWPPIFGKQTEAISNFETLISQQANGPQEERHAQSFLLLGNLYAQAGQVDKAQSIWQQGLSAFPEDESLLGKFGN